MDALLRFVCGPNDPYISCNHRALVAPNETKCIHRRTSANQSMCLLYSAGDSFMRMELCGPEGGKKRTCCVCKRCWKHTRPICRGATCLMTQPPEVRLAISRLWAKRNAIPLPGARRCEPAASKALRRRWQQAVAYTFAGPSDSIQQNAHHACVGALICHASATGVQVYPRKHANMQPCRHRPASLKKQAPERAHICPTRQPSWFRRPTWRKAMPPHPRTGWAH